MLNKILCILIAAICLTFTAEAQSSSKKTTKSTKTSSSRKKKAAQKKKQEAQANLQKFDPKVPTMTLQRYNKGMEKIKSDLLELKIAETIDDKSKPHFTPERCFRSLLEGRQILENFETPEVTKIKPSWFKQYSSKLQQFSKIANKFASAHIRLSSEMYDAAYKEFTAYQKSCLDYLAANKKPPRMRPEELAELKKKNTRQRLINHRKYLRQLKEMELREAKEAEAGAAGKQTKNKK